MASMLTPEDVVRRIAAECTFIDERGAAGKSRRRCCDRRRAILGASQKGRVVGYLRSNSAGMPVCTRRSSYLIAVTVHTDVL
jgi:hypothetical protein